MPNRTITYAQAVREAIDTCLSRDPNVFIIGEGVPDPKGIFGTTVDLVEKYGTDRVMDMPVSESAATGICIGAAIRGMRPILNHQRVDFSVLSFDQIINNAAKWYYMFGAKVSVPLVIRMIIGRGWGQGSQHSQSLQSLFGHIPGLKVVMPATAHDAKGLFIASVEDNNPVIFIDHRWLHYTQGVVPDSYYTETIGKAKVARRGKDITIASVSYMTIEALRAAAVLEKEGVSLEVVDVRTISPLDYKSIIDSVSKTKRLIAADTSYAPFGISRDIIAKVSQSPVGKKVLIPPVEITLPFVPTPTSFKIAENYYPTYTDIIAESLRLLDFPKEKIKKIIESEEKKKTVRSDVPDNSFKGPF